MAAPAVSRDSEKGMCVLRSRKKYMRALETRDLGAKMRADLKTSSACPWISSRLCRLVVGPQPSQRTALSFYLPYL